MYGLNKLHLGDLLFMKQWYLKLSASYKTAVISALITIVLTCLSLLFILCNLLEIPLGILLGGAIGSISYLFFGLSEKTFNGNKAGLGLTILIIVVKFLVLAIVLLFAGYLYYGLGQHIFNLFAIVGGYFISIICNIIITTKEVR